MMSFQLADGRQQVYQWDTGRFIKLVGFASCDHVNFYDPDSDEAYRVTTAQSGSDLTARIPDELLQLDKKIRLYAVGTDEEGRYVQLDGVINLIPRQKPSDYVYDPTEAMTFESVLKEAKGYRDDAAASAEAAETSETNAKASENVAKEKADLVTQKEQAFSQTVEDATEAFNSNAQSKTDEYNENHTEKLEQVNQKASEASNYADEAERWAKGTVEGSAVSEGDGYQDNAKYYKELAESAKTEAEKQAGIASNKASEATDQANIATQKAGEAVDSASAAANSANTASEKATAASNSASNASGSADTATQKASEASQSAGAASDSASAAATSESNALTHANTASDKANVATTKAGEASDSASQAAESKTGADNAKTLAEKYANEEEDVPVETIDGVPQYSAFHYSKKAEAAANSPLASESQAGRSRITSNPDYSRPSDNTDPVAASIEALQSVRNLFKGYKTVIGDGSAKTFTITHNLNTQDIMPMVTGSSVPEWSLVTTNDNTATLTFTEAPAASSITVLILPVRVA